MSCSPVCPHLHCFVPFKLFPFGSLLTGHGAALAVICAVLLGGGAFPCQRSESDVVLLLAAIPPCNLHSVVPLTQLDDLDDVVPAVAAPPLRCERLLQDVQFYCFLQVIKALSLICDRAPPFSNHELSEEASMAAV